jgi:putative hydrolase of the HAD superfamily
MQIDTVLFDLDGTLLDRRATFRHYLERQVSRYASYFPSENSDAYVAELLALDENGSLDRSTFYLEAERRLSLRPGAAEALQADFDARFPESCIAFPGVRETLDLLRASGLKLGIVTNGGFVIQSRKIDGLGVRQLVDSILISEVVGVRKPDPAIFSRALADLSTTASRAMFVGDNPDVDVVGAKRSGLVAVWKRDDFWPEPAEADLVVDDISELVRYFSGNTNLSSA